MQPRLFSLRLFFSTLALVALAFGSACVDSEDSSMTSPAKLERQSDDKEAHVARGPVTGAELASKPDPIHQMSCSNNDTCGWGNRCWDGICVTGAYVCSSDCDCGYGYACMGGECKPDSASPLPRCHCSANCSNGTCNGAACVPSSGGGGGPPVPEEPY